MSLRAILVVATTLVAHAAAAQTPPARAPWPADPEAKIARARALFDAGAMTRRHDGKIVFGREAPGDAATRERNRREARELLRSAAAQASPRARELYAGMVENGIGGEARPALARQTYADAGTRLARWRLARMLEQGRGGPKDLASARRLYKLSGDAGQIDARYDHARMLRAGLGGPKDLPAARAELERTTGFCHGDAADDLAEMAEKGEGGPRNVELAATHYLRALGCANGNFRPPAIKTRWRTIDRDIRIAIQAQLAADHGYAGPRDGAWSPALDRILNGAGANWRPSSGLN
ncbi:MAG: sel1 repeat family protein [Rhizobiales bacterium]|nr:sel1 repeat family protein [Hyphomicrobiales bacterium]